jgi:hypothetical protein
MRLAGYRVTRWWSEDGRRMGSVWFTLQDGTSVSYQYSTRGRRWIRATMVTVDRDKARRLMAADMDCSDGVRQ